MIEAGKHVVRVRCPSCKVWADVPIEISGRLTMDDDDSTIRVKLKQHPAPHMCGQLRIEDEPDGEATPYAGQMRIPDARELAAGGLDLDD